MLSLLYPAAAGADEIFGVVGDYGSTNTPAGTQVNAAAVAAQLNGANPTFVLSLGDQLYGPAGSTPHQLPTPPTSASGYGSSVGALYNQYILANPLLTGSLGANAGTSATMRFFPVLADHDWWTEQTQVTVGTLGTSGSNLSVSLSAPSIVTHAMNGNVTPSSAQISQSAIDNNAQFYSSAQQSFQSLNAYPAGITPSGSPPSTGLAQSPVSTQSSNLVIYGSPNFTKNGDSYETYFAGLYGLSSSQTPSNSIRWYDTAQGSVHVFALSSDPNEIGQGGLKTVNAQDPNAARINLTQSPQGQWFQTALAASTATWNIVELHNPVVSASSPEEDGVHADPSGGHSTANYMQWFDNSKVDLVLSGHVHGYERLYNNGIAYIVNGVGGTWENFSTFCNQTGANPSCGNQFQVAPGFATTLSAISGTTSSNAQMVNLTQMQVGNTYGYQIISTSDASNYLRSQFFGDDGGTWKLLDDFFILKNGTLNAALAGSATGLQLKSIDGVSAGYGIIDTQSQAVSLRALITGTGQLQVTGGGTLTLDAVQTVLGSAPAAGGTERWQFVSPSAVNSYSGGTYVTGNTTLKIASDQLLGAASGGVTLNGGTLEPTADLTSARTMTLGAGNGALHTEAHTVTWSGTISGAGGLIKQGTGTLVLTGANTYTGGTQISAGTVQIGNGGAGGSILGSIVNDGTLSANLTSALTLNGAITGTGRFRQDGTGVTTLSGASGYTGQTRVNAGTLSVLGDISASSDLVVASGATLTGTGLVPVTTVQSGGTLAATSTSSPLTVNGNLTLAAGSTYAVNLASSGSGSASVTGAASLAGALQTNVVTASFSPKTYTILNATNGVSGTFTGLADGAAVTLQGQGSLVKGATIDYTANTVSIVTSGASSNALPGLLPSSAGSNQVKVANIIQQAVNSGASVPSDFDVLLSLSGPQLTSALSQLSGETAADGFVVTSNMTTSFLKVFVGPFGGAPSTFSGAIGYAPDAQAQRSAAAQAAYAAVTPRDLHSDTGERQRWNVWGQVFGGYSRTDGNAGSGTSDTTARTWGLAAAADYRLTPDDRIGFALAGGNTGWSLANALGTGRSDAFQLGLFGAHRFGAAYASLGASYGWHTMRTDRTVTVSTPETLRADFKAHSLAGRLETGFRIPAAWADVTPYAAVQVEQFLTPAYAEYSVSGPSSFALSYSSQTSTTLRTELGSWFEKTIGAGNGNAIVSQGRLAWAHQDTRGGSSSAAFQSLSATSFVVAGARLPQNVLLSGIGLEYRLAGGLSFGARFDAELASGAQSYTGTGTVAYRW